MPEYLVANVDDLVDGEMKEIQFQAGKALLSRIDGQFYATSHLCPHYKAPLVKGTLTTDGRVMCPWHGACFRVQTGDIEDAPSVDHLQSFKVYVKAGKVYLNATEVQVKSGKRVPTCTKPKKDGNGCVIVGGGAGGLVAAETLREGGYQGKITIISRENYLPIDRPKLSKSLKVDAQKIALRSADHLKDLEIEVELDSVVTALDPKTKSVTLSTGSNLTYSQIIISTGGDPRVLPFPGKDLSNIFVMRTVQDVQNIEKGIYNYSDIVVMAQFPTSKPNVVIVGSSFIGMESASVLAKVAKVTVIGMEKVPFERVLGPKVGKAMLELNLFYGINMEMEQFVERYVESKNDSTQVGGVVLKDGRTIPADFVILGAGVIPATSFLKNSGIVLDKDQGISVDGSMQVGGFEDIYAIGDVARYPYHLTGENVRVEHWNVAQNQARLVAEIINLKSRDKEAKLPVFQHIPYFWYVGHATSFDDTIIQGSTQMDSTGGGLGFVAYYLRKGKVVAVCSLGKDPVTSHASELMRLDKMPSGEELRSGLDLLTVPLKKIFKVIEKKKTEELNWILFIALPLVMFAISGFLLSQQ